MSSIHDYDIIARYFDMAEGGWVERKTQLKNVSYESAGREMIKIAKTLDERYGDTATWRVDLYNPDKPEYGSYYQLFHGRTE